MYDKVCAIDSVMLLGYEILSGMKNNNLFSTQHTDTEAQLSHSALHSWQPYRQRYYQTSILNTPKVFIALNINKF